MPAVQVQFILSNVFVLLFIQDLGILPPKVIEIMHLVEISLNLVLILAVRLFKNEITFVIISKVKGTF
jgi:hypothetical protein